MNTVFNMDSPFMKVLTMIANLLWLNILTLVMCLPVFTIGASLTAMHYVLLKLVRGEEGYITKDFFKSFRENFKQASLIWLIFFLVFAVFVGDLVIIYYSNIEFPSIFGVDFPTAMGIVLAIAGMLVFMTWVYVFPTLSHFENTLKKTVINAFMFSVVSFPSTILMLIFHIIFAVVIYYVSYLIPLFVLMGASGLGFLCALCYDGTFKKFEPKEEDVSGESINRAELEM